jgi:hypothetical protein
LIQAEVSADVAGLHPMSLPLGLVGADGRAFVEDIEAELAARIDPLVLLPDKPSAHKPSAHKPSAHKPSAHTPDDQVAVGENSGHVGVVEKLLMRMRRYYPTASLPAPRR